MTLTQFVASLWEQTRRTGPLIFGFLVGGIGIVWAVEAIVERWYSADANALSAPAELMAHTHTAAIALVLLMVYGNTQHLNVAIPQYVLRLPVKTLPLVASRFTFNVLAFSIPALILWHAAGFIGPTTFPALEMVGGYLLAFLYAQAWCWLTGAIPGIKTRTALFFSVPLAATLWTSLGLNADIAAGVFFIGAPPLMTLLAAVGIERQRRGETLLETGWLHSVLDRDRDDGVPQFSSAEEAQIWFERRQLASTLLTTVLVIGILGTLFAVLIGMQGATTYIHESDTGGVVAFYLAETSSLIWLTSLTIGALTTAAIAFLNQYRWQWGPGKSFFFARPLSTKQIARCRILASRKNFWQVARLVLFIAGVAAAVNFFYATGGGSRPYLEEASNVRVIGVASLYAAMVVFIAWSALWIENIFVMGAGILGGASLAEIVGSGNEGAVAAATIVSVVILLTYIYFGLRQGSFANVTLGRAVALTLGAACIVVCVAVGTGMDSILVSGTGSLLDENTWIGLIVAFFVFAPFVSTHFMLHTARHR